MDAQLSQGLNTYLADLSLSYIKVHNLHWNVVGPQFKAAHEYLESIYDGISDELDAVAELLKMKGETPAASLAEYLKLATISEIDSKEIEVGDALKVLLQDLKTLRSQALALHELAGNDFAVTNLLEDHVENYNKSIWFVESMLK
ncbi:MAG: Dps family protein [Atopobiaceae bacterium]|jgi:starvation-inducible DNA-binding protein